jgi:NAD(P)-dependent dehydrogenase (short-subunit alcohol dehydrogenase family)
MPTILITGANRGIGQALCQSYLADGWRVLATSRSKHSHVPDSAEHYLLDVTQEESIAALRLALSGMSIDIIWNNAGVYLDKDCPLTELSSQIWQETFAINTIAPIKIAQALRENLRDSTIKTLAFTTSKMGSIDSNGQQATAYRSSKAALNMAVRCLAQDLAPTKTHCLLLHPGHVVTDMGGKEGKIDTKTSVAAMRSIVDCASEANYPAFNSQFFDIDGTTINW